MMGLGVGSGVTYTINGVGTTACSTVPVEAQAASRDAMKTGIHS
jgi:hypothetical protein